MPPKSTAEIQREYRRRRDADPDQRRKYLQHERLKYHADLSHADLSKLVKDMSERQARQQRRDWKIRQRKSRCEDFANSCRQKDRGRKRMRRENKMHTHTYC